MGIFPGFNSYIVNGCRISVSICLQPNFMQCGDFEEEVKLSVYIWGKTNIWKKWSSSGGVE